MYKSRNGYKQFKILNKWKSLKLVSYHYFLSLPSVKTKNQDSYKKTNSQNQVPLLLSSPQVLILHSEASTGQPLLTQPIAVTPLQILVTPPQVKVTHHQAQETQPPQLMLLPIPSETCSMIKTWPKLSSWRLSKQFSRPSMLTFKIFLTQTNSKTLWT